MDPYLALDPIPLPFPSCDTCPQIIKACLSSGCCPPQLISPLILFCVERGSDHALEQLLAELPAPLPQAQHQAHTQVQQPAAVPPASLPVVPGSSSSSDVAATAAPELAEGAGIQLRVSPRPAIGSGAHPLTAAVLDLLLDVVLLTPDVSYVLPGPTVPPTELPMPLTSAGTKAPSPILRSNARLGAITPASPSSSSSTASPALPSAASVSAARVWLCPLLGAALARTQHVPPAATCMRLLSRLYVGGSLDMALARVTEGLPPPPPLPASSAGTGEGAPWPGRGEQQSRSGGGSGDRGVSEPTASTSDSNSGGVAGGSRRRERKSAAPPPLAPPPPPPGSRSSGQEGGTGGEQYGNDGAPLVTLLVSCGSSMQQRLLLLAAGGPASTQLQAPSTSPRTAAMPWSASPQTGEGDSAADRDGSSSFSSSSSSPHGQQLAAAVFHIIAGADHAAIAAVAAAAAEAAAAARRVLSSSSSSADSPGLFGAGDSVANGGNAPAGVRLGPPPAVPDASSANAAASDTPHRHQQPSDPASKATTTEKLRAYLESEGFTPAATAALMLRLQPSSPSAPDTPSSFAPLPLHSSPSRTLTPSNGPNLAASAELSEAALSELSTHRLAPGSGLPALLLALHDHCVMRHGTVLQLNSAQVSYYRVSQCHLVGEWRVSLTC